MICTAPHIESVGSYELPFQDLPCQGLHFDNDMIGTTASFFPLVHPTFRASDLSAVTMEDVSSSHVLTTASRATQLLAGVLLQHHALACH